MFFLGYHLKKVLVNVFRGLILFFVSAFCLLGISTGTAAIDQKSGSSEQPASTDRVDHYAFLSTGWSGSSDLTNKYLLVNQRIYEVLKEYGYPEEAIYRLSEFGATQTPRINGVATASNFRKTFQHLAGILKESDHVVIFIIGHGYKMTNGDYGHPLMDGPLSAVELRSLINMLPAKDLTIVFQSCYAGNFLAAAGGKDRVVVCATKVDEVNYCPWVRTFIDGLSPEHRNAGTPPSILDAYHASLAADRDWYGDEIKEHPLLDDNGDSVGHFLGDAAEADGDGRLAARRFLGNNGRPLRFSKNAIADLRKLNSRLVLSNLTGLRNVFASESVFLANWGGYKNDIGANSIMLEDHLAWAKKNPPYVIAGNLLKKYIVQFNLQAGKGKDFADRFYANASVSIARYGIDLGNSGANSKGIASHLKWAKKKSIMELRMELEKKVRALTKGASAL